jgi:hypothetical protein
MVQARKEVDASIYRVSGVEASGPERPATGPRRHDRAGSTPLSGRKPQAVGVADFEVSWKEVRWSSVVSPPGYHRFLGACECAE